MPPVQFRPPAQTLQDFVGFVDEYVLIMYYESVFSIGLTLKVHVPK